MSSAKFDKWEEKLKMLNQSVIVGRVANFQRNSITLAVPRSYKNKEGMYETDFITCKLCGSMLENAKEYLKNGDLIGIKGRLEQQTTDSRLLVVAEKLTFLSSKRENEETKEEQNESEENEE